MKRRYLPGQKPIPPGQELVRCNSCGKEYRRAGLSWHKKGKRCQVDSTILWRWINFDQRPISRQHEGLLRAARVRFEKDVARYISEREDTPDGELNMATMEIGLYVAEHVWLLIYNNSQLLRLFPAFQHRARFLHVWDRDPQFRSAFMVWSSLRSSALDNAYVPGARSDLGELEKEALDLLGMSVVSPGFFLGK